MTLYEMLAVVWRRRWLFLAIVAVVVALGLVRALTAVPVYRGQVVMIPTQDDVLGNLGGLGQLGGLAALAGVNIGRPGDIKDEALATLQSRAFTGRFIEQRNLLPVLYHRKWDEDAKTWRPDVRPPTLGDGVRMFERRIRSVSEDRRTGVVTLNIDWTDRELVAAWANEMVEELNREMRERTIAEARRSIEYLDREFAAADVIELRAAIARLKENQVKRVMLASVRDQFAFRVIDPARTPDPDKRIRPRRSLIVLASGVLGGVLGLLVVAFLEWWPRQRARTARDP